MSTLAIPQHSPDASVTSSERSSLDIIKENLSNSNNWSYLVPVIGALALGVIFAPTAVPMGVAFGVGSFAVFGLAAAACKVMGLYTEDKNSKYQKFLEGYALHGYALFGTLVGPVVEEGIFRGFIQPLATRVVLFIAPAGGAAFMGTGLSIAVTVSIVATGTLFGFLHFFNQHKNSGFQAIAATFSGITFGVAAAQFGLPAAIAAHVVHNTIVITLCKLIEDRTPHPAPITSA